MAQYQAVTGRAQNVANTPYQAYGGQLVAPINAQQTTGIGAINNASGIQDPYNAVAGGLGAASAGNISATQFSPQQLSQYMNPYQQDVIQATEAEINNQNAQQAAQLEGGALGSGAFGGDRAGIGQAALAGQQDIASNATIAGLNAANFQNAESEFNTQQGVNLAAAQNTAGRQLAASQQLGALGNTAQSEALNEANAETNAGTLQQQTGQATDTAAYNQFLQQQAYPFQTTGWLANIVEGIGSQSGGTSTGQTTTYGGNGLSSAFGGLLGLASFLKDGGRVPQRGIGGGLGAGSPYAGLEDPTMGGGVAAGYVPTINLPVGHTMPNGQMQQTGIANNQGNYQQIANGIKGLSNSGIGDRISDFAQDTFGDNGGGLLSGIFAKGGSVPHYVYGGDVVLGETPGLTPQDLLPKTNDSSLLQNALTGVAPPPNGDPRTPEATAALAAAMPRTPTAADYAKQMPQPGLSGVAPAPVSAPTDLAPPRGPSQPINNTSTGAPASAWATPAYSGPAPTTPIDPTAYPNTQAGHEQFIRDYAMRRGVDPDFAVSVAKAEGLAALSPKNPNSASYVDIDPKTGRPFSFGDFQLNVRNGLGNAALANGIDPRDPNQWQKADMFALDTMKKGGLQPWRGDKAVVAYQNGQAAPSGGPPVASAGLGPSTPVTQSGAPATPEQEAQQTQQRSGLLGLNLPDNVRQGLLAAGLGIMGGNSLNPWQNIGQGGLKGIGTMMAGQKLQSEIGLQGAQTQGVQLENQMKAAAVKQMLEQLTQHESAGNAKADSVANAVEGGVTSPGVTAPTVTGRGVAPIQLNPEFDPQVLTARINAEKWTNPGAANADKERLAELMKTGKSYDTRGNIVNLPGFVGSEADRAANVKGAESAAASHYDLVETQPEGGGPTQWVPKSQVLAGNVGIPVGVGAGSPPGKVSDTVAANNPVIAKQPSFYADKQKEIGTQENEMLSQMQARQLAKQRLGAIQTLMQTYQPGAFAEQKADFVAAAKSLGIKMPDTVTANPAAFQEFTKNATANVFNDVKSMGGRVLVAEIAGLTKANVNPELQPAAAAALIGQARGVIDYEDQHTKDYFAWKKQHPNSADTSDFELPWMEKNQVSDFVAKADKGIAYSGQDIPQPAQRTVGQTYMTPKGPRTWQGNGWMKP